MNRQFDRTDRGFRRGRGSRGGSFYRGGGGGGESGGYNKRRSNYRGGSQKSNNWNRPNSSGARVGAKRPWSRNENTEAKKRQKSNHAQLPLSTILLARHGDKDGKAPELVFGGFYECNREAKIGRESHFLRINATRRKDKISETVSIPVPLESIGAVSVISGMNKVEKLLKAHTDRISLLASIERSGRIMEKREGVYAAKMEELALMPVIEEEPEQEAEEKSDEEVEKKEEQVIEDQTEAETDMAVEDATEEDTQDNLLKKEQQEEERRLALEKKKLDDEKKAAAKMKLEAERKERELKREERRFVEAAVEKLAASVEKVRKSIEDDQEKLAKLDEEFGERLALFQNETDSDEARRVFLEELHIEETEVVSEIVPEETQEDVVEEAVDEAKPSSEAEPDEDEAIADGDKETEEQPETEVVKEAEKEEGDVKMADATPATRVCTFCGASGVESGKFCGECGRKQEEIKVEKEDKFDRISESPVWLVLALKKPLEKFYATDVDTTICNKELLEKSSMIVLGYNPKTPSSEHLKSLNEVLEGPWKGIRKKAKQPMAESPYSLEKTLHYLIKMHVRQDVSDNTIETCELCGGKIKRMDLERHMTQVCMMRKEECPYCGKVLVMKDMDEHHLNECPSFPIPCPQKCGIAKFPRSEVQEHFKVCKNTVVCCNFDSLGCETKVKRRELARHMRDGAVDHVQLLKTRLKLVTDYLQTKDQDLEEVFNPPPPPPAEEGDAEEGDAEEGGNKAPAEGMEIEKEQQ